MYGPEWPAETYYPTVALADQQVVDVDGLSITAREMGEAESHADSYYLVRAGDAAPIAFTGDLSFNGTHAYTADGHTASWLDALNTLRTELADVRQVLPGHGGPTDPRLLDDQRRYLMYYREVVARLSAGGQTLDDAAKSELEQAMQQFLPGAPLVWMIGLGADAVASELASAADQGAALDLAKA